MHFSTEKILHGGDYNPDQWLVYPEILERDIELMKKAAINTVTLGVFAWSSLEPTEGVFNFAWMDDIMDKLHQNGISVILATPSATMPAWLAQKYPEVNRDNDDIKNAFRGVRHGHCPSSPVYRQKVEIINKKLSERYAGHPALKLWHISNEYGGECRCPQCRQAFRDWLKSKYGTLDALNAAWWSAFWSQTYTDWSQIYPPAPGEKCIINALDADFKRFVTHMTVDFYLHEVRAVRAGGSDAPCTTNFTGLATNLDYFTFAKHVDVLAYDIYPMWHSSGEDFSVATHAAMAHDVMRSAGGGKPWLLMECTPSTVNWSDISKLKRPKLHTLSCIQAIAHGSDSALLFQFRKGRGGFEKFHGAVVDHDDSEHHRVFREVAETGAVLKRLAEIVGTTPQSRTAIFYDFENKWLLEGSQGPRNKGMDYYQSVFSFYNQLAKRGISTDFVCSHSDLSGYNLLFTPMLYMLEQDTADRIREFVRQGGTLITTCGSGYVDGHDLCHLGGFPGHIRDLLGLKIDEIDGLYDHDKNSMDFLRDNMLGMTGSYECGKLCELITLEGATSLAVFGSDFYKGSPAVTRNCYGKGQAYHIASLAWDGFYSDFIESLTEQLGTERILDTALPEGVLVQARHSAYDSYIFLMNFNPEARQVTLDGRSYTDMLTKKAVQGAVLLDGYGFAVLKRKR